MSDEDALVELLKRIRKNLVEGAYRNEAMVSGSIVRPILEKLGWDILNPLEVYPEYPLEREKVDYALCKKDKPLEFIEVKSVGKNVGSGSGAEDQLFQYAWKEGAPLVVLTDGNVWRVFLTYLPGEGRQREVRNFKIADIVPEAAARDLRRYLGRDEVISKRALDNALADHEDLEKLESARNAIPRIWEESINENESSIVEALTAVVAEKHGIAPSEKDVREFLKGVASSNFPSQQKKHVPESRLRLEQGGNRSRGIKASYSLLGSEWHNCANASIAYAEILAELNARNPGLMEKMAEEFGKSQFTRNKEDLIRGRQARSFGDWHVGTNINNSTKVERLEHACKIARIEFGKDLVVEFPNA